MHNGFEHLKQKIKPFHLYGAWYAFILVTGLVYKFFKQ